MSMIDYKAFSEKFLSYCGQYNIAADGRILKDFYLFTEYLLTENEKYNLTSITEIDGIILKHYIDSIIILKYFDLPENSRIIDIGTGAGFPALPLSVMRGDLKMTFLDGSNKKINFIKNAPVSGNFNFYCGRAEDLGRDAEVRETYDFAVSRAVARLNVLCELASPFIRAGGFFIAYKGRNAGEEIAEAGNAFKVLGLEIAETAELDLFDFEGNGEETAKRFFIKIKKIKKTPEKYPRKFADISKKPL